MRNMTLRSFAAHLGISIEANIPICGYRADSRLIEIGDLFFALKGARTDGHNYLFQARQKGAIAAVVDQSYLGSDYGLILLPVSDVLASLQHAATCSLAITEPLVVAITGSVGKTTTKEFIATLLAGKYTVAKTLGNENTQITLPLTVLNRGEEKVLVLEMGMSKPGEIEKLVQIAPPDIAVLTKVALSHVEAFPGGLEEIAREKKQIFSHVKTKIAFVPDQMEVSISHVQTKFCSQVYREADYFLSVVDDKGYIDESSGLFYCFNLPFRQSHLLYNLLFAVAVARYLQMSWAEIDGQLPLLRTPAMRFEQLEYEGVCLINDAYNANPESMRVALSNLPLPKEGGKKIAVLASMKELGKFSEVSHREIGLFAQHFVDHLLCFGSEAAWIAQEFSLVGKPAEHFMDKNDLGERLKALMHPGDVVLLKGSRSMQLKELLDMITRPLA